MKKFLAHCVLWFWASLFTLVVIMSAATRVGWVPAIMAAMLIAVIVSSIVWAVQELDW